MFLFTFLLSFFPILFVFVYFDCIGVAFAGGDNDLPPSHTPE